MEPTYWNDHGKYQTAADALSKLIPTEGPVLNPADSPALEKFRQASNCYYDVYNNGLCNRAKEFRRVFGFGGMLIPRSDFKDAAAIAKLDAAMDAIVAAAAVEQGVTVRS